MKPALILVFLSVAVLASALTAPAQTGVQARSPRTPGAYEVPTENEELREFANFDVDEIRIEERGRRTRLSYRLPIELVGAPQRLHFTGNQGLSGILKGEFGEMLCEESAPALDRIFVTCEVVYKNLQVNEVARKNALRQISTKPGEFEKRLELARGFERDPHGFIAFERPLETNRGSRDVRSPLPPRTR